MEQRRLDSATRAMLLKYDEDGNGIFSKEEVSKIVIDLHRTMQQNVKLDNENKLFRKCVWGMLFFSIVLLSSLFALSFAAAKLAQQTMVDSNGVMLVNNGGHTVVATDSSASRFELNSTIVSDDQSAYCIGEDFADMLKGKVLNGNSVLLQFNGDQSSRSAVEKIEAGGMTLDTTANKLCFSLTNSVTNSSKLCIQESETCMEAHRRKLGKDDDDDFQLVPIILRLYLGIAWE